MSPPPPIIMYISLPRSLSFCFFCIRLLTHNSLEHELCSYYCRGDCLKTKLMVCFFTNRIVYSTYDLFNLKDLFRNLARHDVTIITIGDGSECIGFSNASTYEHILIDPITDKRLPTELRGETLESITAKVNHR